MKRCTEFLKPQILSDPPLCTSCCSFSAIACSVMIPSSAEVKTAHETSMPLWSWWCLVVMTTLAWLIVTKPWDSCHSGCGYWNAGRIALSSDHSRLRKHDFLISRGIFVLPFKFFMAKNWNILYQTLVEDKKNLGTWAFSSTLIRFMRDFAELKIGNWSGEVAAKIGHRSRILHQEESQL